MQSSIALDAPPSLASLIEGGRAALFLDFDGTLVELASGPDAIEPLSDLAVRLEGLSVRLEGRCALVSGRSVSDIERHIGPVPTAVAGSHGADIRGPNGEPIGQSATGFPPALEAALRGYASENAIDFERKPHGGALHYRSNPKAGPAAHEFAEKLAAEHDWAVQTGKCVVEIIPRGANKGSAVHTLIKRAPFAGAKPIFLGDDVTDEAGFAACEELGGAGILVGEARETKARYRLPSVPAVHQWLEL